MSPSMAKCIGSLNLAYAKDHQVAFHAKVLISANVVATNAGLRP